MRFALRILCLSVALHGAPSFAASPPPSQASVEREVFAEIKPEFGSAARFARRGIIGLPAAAVFRQVEQVKPAVPMAPERLRPGVPPLSAEHPESRLRQAVVLRLRAGTAVETAVNQLQATGLFRDVRAGRAPAVVRFAQANTEPLATEPPSGDPHRWQWALPAIRASGSTGAWNLTLGRSQVASLDGGIVPSHPDVMEGPLSNLRLHVSGGWDVGGLSSAYLFDQSTLFGPYVNHGTHVNTLMAAPINGAGMAGACPGCTLQTFRWTGGDVMTDSATLAGRFGSTAVNMSFEPFNPGSGPQTLFEPALRMMDDRDVVQIAAAGNRAAPRTGWASLGVPHRLDWVLKVAASDRDNGYWDELRLLTLPAQRRHPVSLRGHRGLRLRSGSDKPATGSPRTTLSRLPPHAEHHRLDRRQRALHPRIRRLRRE